MAAEFDAIIIGAGLSGLVCARQLCAHGVTCRLLESQDTVGGRVQTDDVDGFRLDRGFQVFLTAYPEAQRWLDYGQLDLCRFEPGAMIRFAGKFHRLADPWRRPQHWLATAISPAATLSDKLRIPLFRRHTTRGEIEELYRRPEQPTMDLLRGHGFSDVIIERFFRPFFGGVFLDRDLQTSSRLCEFVFRMFALGEAALPQNGMGEIPRQLARQLPPDVVRTQCHVQAIDGRDVVLSGGERLSARAIIVATEAPAARRLLDDPFPADGRSVHCLYFAAEAPPVKEPILVLNGDGSGPINNLCVPSQVSPGYAPGGQSLVSVTVLHDYKQQENLMPQVTRQLQAWFGSAVASWRHLKTYDIRYALPVQAPPALQPVEKPATVREGVFVCGDHCDTASINGAMAAGRRAAEAVCAALNQT